MTYKLCQGTDPVLRQVAEPVGPGELDVALINDMEAILKFNQALGLAAPQVGVSKRVIMVRYGLEILTMINPKITKADGGKGSIVEECLSYPGLKRRVPRDKRIKVTYLDCYGEPQKRKFKGLDATVVQHEIDHLDGITLKFPRGL